tara:strand:+ start:224 stop:403 length:180 start_codon:yes stop_codon:yes gene_type:complete
MRRNIFLINLYDFTISNRIIKNGILKATDAAATFLFPVKPLISLDILKLKSVYEFISLY